MLAEEVRWTGPVGAVVVGRPLACGGCGSGSKLAVRDGVETGREVLIPTDDCGYVAIYLGGLETDPIETGPAARLVEDPLLVHGAFALEGQVHSFQSDTRFEKRRPNAVKPSSATAGTVAGPRVSPHA